MKTIEVQLKSSGGFGDRIHSVKVDGVDLPCVSATLTQEPGKPLSVTVKLAGEVNVISSREAKQ